MLGMGYNQGMLQYISDVNKAVEGLGIIATNQGPLLRMLIRNWPLTVLAGGAIALRLYDRHKKGDLTLYTGMVDSGYILGPAVSLLFLAHLARLNEAAKPELQPNGPVPQPPPQAPVQGYPRGY